MSKKVYVGNLPFKYRGKELRELFVEYVIFGSYPKVVLEKITSPFFLLIAPKFIAFWRDL